MALCKPELSLHSDLVANNRLNNNVFIQNVIGLATISELKDNSGLCKWTLKVNYCCNQDKIGMK